MLLNRAKLLHEKDRKILHELDKNARQSNADIGRKVGLTSPAVRDRIKNLMKKEILTGFLTVINTEKIGYTFYNMYLKTNFSSWDEEQECINYLKNHPNVGWFASFNGVWSMFVGIMVKDRKHYDIVSRDIFNKIGKNLVERTSSQPLAAYYCKHKFLDDIKIMDKGFYHITTPVELDEKDFKILHLLDENPRISLLEMAEKTNIAHKVAHLRLKKLMQTGVIQEFRPIIDLHKLGYQWYHVQFKLNSENENEKMKFIGYLKAHPKVFYIIDSIGVCNLIAEFLTEGSDDFQKIIKELKDKFPNIIHSYEPLLITKEHNHSYFPKDLAKLKINEV